MNSPIKTRAIGVFCGSAPGADPAYMELAASFGRALADRGMKLVYGGGGVGLMGAAARAAHEAGGAVLGVIPEFLRMREVLYDDVETIVVRDLHTRKRMMADAADGFVILPGGIGTLEEVVEILSWARLDLHQKLTIFLDQDGYWDTFFNLIEHQIDRGFTPPLMRDLMARASSVEETLEKFAVHEAKSAAS